MDAVKGCEIQPGFALFSERFGNRSPDLILYFGCRRAWNGLGGIAALLARLDQPQHPDFAVGIIEVAAAIAAVDLIESDPALSKPITDDPSAPNPGAGDWFVLIDGTDVGPVSAVMPRFSGNAALKPLIISSGVYRLMWDLGKSDIGG